MRRVKMNFIRLLFLLASLGIFIQPESSVADSSKSLKKATFAGGCFWCMEKPFEKLPGVISVTSGYLGGITKNPTYENYSSGGHIEVVEILYDPSRVSYNQLLETFWRQIDPTDANGQFADRGYSYSTAIFYHNENQKNLALKSKSNLAKKRIFSKPIVTKIKPASYFYRAESYHQDYYKKNPLRYKYYRYGSGRDRFLDKVWGKDR